jgi:hypothetical protein
LVLIGVELYTDEVEAMVQHGFLLPHRRHSRAHIGRAVAEIVARVLR